eukprot:2445474-Rhodomonas_salina.1
MRRAVLAVLAVSLVADVNAFQAVPSMFSQLASKPQAWSVSRPVCAATARTRGALLQTRMTATAPPEADKKDSTDPTKDDMAKMPLGFSNMLSEIENIRTADIVTAYKKGDIGKREASTLTLKRVKTKLGMKGAAQLTTDETAAQRAVFMEGGWAKRGKGSGVIRTVELYSFGIKIILRELKLRKIEDKAAKSEARKGIARDLREVRRLTTLIEVVTHSDIFEKTNPHVFL